MATDFIPLVLSYVFMGKWVGLWNGKRLSSIPNGPPKLKSGSNLHTYLISDTINFLNILSSKITSMSEQPV